MWLGVDYYPEQWDPALMELTWTPSGKWAEM